MRKFVINVVPDGMVEIVVPSKSRDRRSSIVCLCCERAGQPMDHDGCGICDVCLGSPLPAPHGSDGLEDPTPSSHLSLTACNL